MGTRSFLAAWTTLFITLLAISAQVSAQEKKPAVTAKVSGTVVKDDGSPVADARVLILRRGMIVGRANTREVKSGADGSFTFDEVKPGEYRVWAIQGNTSSREKRFMGEIVAVPKTGDAPPTVKLTMRPGQRLKATVKTPDGKPIAGATVHVPLSDFGVDDFTTGNDGTVTIEAFPNGASNVQAFAPGKARTSKSVNFDNEDATVDFTLADGGAIFGRITDPDGKPAAKVSVSVYASAGGGGPGGQARTADDGTYRIDNLPLTSDQRVMCGDDKHFEGKSNLISLSPEKRELEFNVTLDLKPPGGSIAGTVLDDAGKPVAGAKIFTLNGNNSTKKSATTDEAGTFRIDDIERTRHRAPQICVIAAGWAPYLLGYEPGTKQSPAKLDVRLSEKGRRIAGRVVDDKGNPIRDAWVTAGSDDAFALDSQNVTTGADGKFKFDTLPADVSFNVRVRGYSPIEGQKLALDGDEEVQVSMLAAGGIAGTVVDADSGKPIPKFNIRLRMSPRSQSYMSMSMDRIDKGEDFSSPAGAFRLGELTAGGVVTLMVSADGYPAQYIDDVPTTPGASGPPVEIKLAKQPADYVRVAGQIVDGAGKPIAGVEMRLLAYVSDGKRDEVDEFRFNWGMLRSGQLRIQPRIRTIEQTKSGADGTFAFPLVPPGDGVDLAYWGTGVPQTRIERLEKLEPADREKMLIRSAGPASLAGRINRKAYPRVSSLEIHGISDRKFELNVPFDKTKDAYTVGELPPGRYSLDVMGELIRADTDGLFFYPRVSRNEFEVSSGERKTLDLGFEPAHVVAGIVTIDGKPAAKAYVAIYRVINAAQGNTEIQEAIRTDAEGRYRFSYVIPGKYLLVSTGDKPPDGFEQMNQDKTRVRAEIDVTDADVEKDLEAVNPAGL